MRPKNYHLPVVGPASNPVLFGVAHGLNDLFPPVELFHLREDMEVETDENDTSDDSHREHQGRGAID